MRWFSPLAPLFSIEDAVPLQIRLFRLICAATGVLCLAVVLPFNALQNLPLAVNITDVALGLFALYCLWASRRNRHHTTLFFVVFAVLLNPVWFLNAGAQGSVNYYFFPLALYPIAVIRGRLGWGLTALLGLDFCGLLILGYFAPRLVVPFQSPLDQVIDLVSGAFCSFLALVMVGGLIVDSHDREERRLSSYARALAASELRLRESKQRLADVFLVVAEGIVVQDPAGATNDCNQAAERILGRGRDQIVGRNAMDLFGHAVHPDGSVFRPEDYPLAVTVRTGKPLRGVEMGISPNGQPAPQAWMLINTEPLLDDAGVVRMVVTSFSDITERKQAEADRLVLSKLESTGVLAGGIAHDFNNLLTAIVLSLEMAQTDRGAQAETRGFLREAGQAALAARKLTQQLITFAQGGDPVRELADVESVVRDSVRIALSGLTVADRITTVPGLWPALIDPGQIGQVFRNLTQNAAEAMPHGGTIAVGLENVTIDAANGLSLPPGDYVKASITDTGSGIPPEVLPRIFDPYFSTKARGEQKGMGLGLTICHSVVQRHQGTITIESTPGEGTTVCVHLPAMREKIPAAEAPAAEAPAASAPGENRVGHVLVMDDESSIRNLVGIAARQMGCQVTLASDGQEAVKMFSDARSRGEGFDLVILDLTVRNGMGGVEALQHLRAMNPQVKAVVMSGYANNEALQQHARHGFKDALRKPFNIAGLQSVISRVLNS